MIFFKKTIRFFLLFFLLLNNFKVYSFIGKIDEILAVVNSDIILKSDFDEFFKKNKIYFNKNIERNKNIIRKQLLEKLIEDKIIFQVAKREGIIVSEGEVNNDFYKIAKINGMTIFEFRKRLRFNNINLKDYKKDILKKKIFEKVYSYKIFPRIKILKEELDSFLNMVNLEISKESMLNLEHIFVPISKDMSDREFVFIEKSVQKIVKNIKNGINFSESTRNFSNLFYLENKKIGWVKFKNLLPFFSERLIVSKIGDVIGPIFSDWGFHILKVNQIRNNLKKLNYSHIFIKFSDFVNQKEAYKKILFIFKKIKNKKITFSNAVKTFSEDFSVVLNNRKFKLDFLDVYNILFKNIIKNLKNGEISQPFCSKFGCHLIKVEKKLNIKKSNIVSYENLFKILFKKKFYEEKEKWLKEEKEFSYIKVF